MILSHCKVYLEPFSLSPSHVVEEDHDDVGESLEAVLAARGGGEAVTPELYV